MTNLDLTSEICVIGSGAGATTYSVTAPIVGRIGKGGGRLIDFCVYGSGSFSFALALLWISLWLGVSASSL